eukprot:TRINITY_DN2523_c0_g1_i1.p1 TRINITY_DN2523_c0_g1~~TRINITY_DN2523_c0_g1_i1.p1  ORF type:complete len:827 (+),score=163.63 TRINITY_DN2523_c0_g1_i1:2-2482(+)
MEENTNNPVLQSLPKDMKFIVFTHLDAQSLGRLMQTNKSFNTLPAELNLWKHICLTTWKLSSENLKKIESIAATVNWHREYRVLTYYSRRIYGNQLEIRPNDLTFVKAIDEDLNSLHFYSDQPVDAIAVQSKFKLYPLPKVNFGVAYYELTVEQLNEKEPTIGIGFALHRYIRAFPGWGKDSYGVHGDNGHFYNQRSFGMHRCDIWAVSDTVGFGINYAKNEIFLTRNGVLVSVIAKKVRNLKHMYATIGMRAVDNKCRVNFGQKPFEFDIEEYMKNLEQDPEFVKRWPAKFYSQIIQEIENSFIDDENPEEVEEELIGGLDYYEKTEQPSHDHHHDEHQHGHADNEHHVHGENCDHDHEDGHDENELTTEEINHNKHKEYLEWLFNRLAGLETEVTQQAIDENSPDIREITVRLIENLQFNVDPNLPLEELVHQTRLEMIGFMSVQYHSYLVEEKALRMKREAANPNLKKRKLNGMDLFLEENRLIFIADKKYADNHPLILAAVRQLSQLHNINIPDLNNIAWEDRVDTVLFMAYRLYCARRFIELEEKRAQRRRTNEKARSEKENEFEKIFGKDSFVPFSSLENLQRLIENTGEPGGNFQVSEDDLCNATEFCSMKYYGGILRNPKLATTDRILLETLNWWICVPEVPFTPEMSLEEFRFRCVKIAEEKVVYYEDDRERCESIVRGSIGLLRTPSIIENDRLLIVVLLGWIELILSVMHENHEVTNEELSIELIKQLTLRLEKMDQTFEELQATKQQIRDRRALLLAELQEQAENERKNERKNNNNTANTASNTNINVPLIAASVAAVAILGAAFVFFKNKLRK